MDFLNLPQDIYPDYNPAVDTIIFHDYTAEKGSFKGKSILHKNAFSLVISGNKTMLFADKSVQICDDELHLLSAGNCLASVNLSGKNQFRSILVFFDNSVLTGFLLKYDALIRKIPSKTKLKPEPYIAFKKDAFVLNFIESLSLIFRKRSGFSHEMKILKFEELMLHLLEQYPERILAFQSNRDNSSEELHIRTAVETNITNQITIEELAFLCNMSASTFKRKFSKLYGTSPNKWIQHKRMEMARHLLLNCNEKPGEVYHKIGYENHSSFSQSFKQTFGLTPREFQTGNMTVLQ